MLHVYSSPSDISLAQNEEEKICTRMEFSPIISSFGSFKKYYV